MTTQAASDLNLLMVHADDHAPVLEPDEPVAPATANAAATAELTVRTLDQAGTVTHIISSTDDEVHTARAAVVRRRGWRRRGRARGQRPGRDARVTP